MKLKLFDNLIITLKSLIIFVVGLSIIIISIIKWFFLIEFYSRLTFGILIGLIFFYIGYDLSWKTFCVRKLERLEQRFDSHLEDKGGVIENG